MAQFARPDSDISTTGWTDQVLGSTNIYQTMDEVTYSDADYIIGEDPSVARIGLSDVTDPASSSGHIVRYRWATGRVGKAAELQVHLYQGTTLIASGTLHTVPATSFAAASFTLTSGEADNITDYTTLEFRFDFSVDGGGGQDARFSWAELEVPDPPAATEESVTLAKFKGVSSPVTYAGAPVSLTLSRDAGQSAAELGNVQEALIENRISTTTPSALISGEEIINLAKTTDQSVEGGLSVEETLDLTKTVDQSTAELGNVQEAVAQDRVSTIALSDLLDAEEIVSLSKVNTVVPSALISGEDVVNLNRVGAIAPSAFGIFDQSVSMARSIALAVLEAYTSTIQESISLSRLLAAAAESQEVSIEEVNLAKVATVSTASQLVAYSATSLNRINTIPTNTLGTLYELVNLAHLDGLSVLEETQGQINESITLNRVLATLAETLIEGNEDVDLAEVLGLISDSQETSQEAVGLGASHGLSVLEETQGSVEESVTLTRLMGVVSSSQAVIQGELTLNRYFTLGAASKHVAMESVIFGSTYGLSSAVFPQISELVPLTRVNTISLADNVTALEAVNLLLSLLITAEPSSIFEISQIHNKNVLFVKYRDKRYRVIFRDKRG